MKNQAEIPSSEHLLTRQKDYDLLVSENKQLQQDNFYLKHELEQLKRMIYGSKSERYRPQEDGQLSMFDNVDLSSPEQQEEQDSISYTRNKQKKAENKGHARMRIAEHIPRQEEIIEPTQDVSKAKRIGEVVTEILDYTPGSIHVRKIVRPKYALPRENGILIAEMPSLPIPRGNAGAGLLANIFVSKFVDHLPLHRQRQMFKREGVDMAESTINDWQTQVCDLLEPLYDKLRNEVLKENYLMADESPIPVLSKNKPGSTHKGYHWVYYSPRTNLVIFDYQKGRGQESPQQFLKTYEGALQTDGYAGYNSFAKKKEITILACMAHARRKFESALKEDPQKAGYVLSQIQQLYQIERKVRDAEGKACPEKRKILRQEESVPILDSLEKWMKEQVVEVLPKSAMGKALAYTLNLWDRLRRYVDDGNWEIDNNLVENSIRPLALGRKNYMFAGSHQGAQRAAIFYSFFGSCKKAGINPYTWLKDILERIPEHKANQLQEILPHNWRPLKK